MDKRDPVRLSKSRPDLIDEAFGGAKCELGDECELQIVRPGKTRCERCD